MAMTTKRDKLDTELNPKDTSKKCLKPLKIIKKICVSDAFDTELDKLDSFCPPPFFDKSKKCFPYLTSLKYFAPCGSFNLVCLPPYGMLHPT